MADAKGKSGRKQPSGDDARDTQLGLTSQPASATEPAADKPADELITEPLMARPESASPLAAGQPTAAEVERTIARQRVLASAATPSDELGPRQTVPMTYVTALVESNGRQIDQLLKALEHVAIAQQAMLPDYKIAQEAARRRRAEQLIISVACTALVVLLIFYVRQTTIDTVTRNCVVQSELLKAAREPSRPAPAPAPQSSSPAAPSQTVDPNAPGFAAPNLRPMAPPPDTRRAP